MQSHNNFGLLTGFWLFLQCTETATHRLDMKTKKNLVLYANPINKWLEIPKLQITKKITKKDPQEWIWNLNWITFKKCIFFVYKIQNQTVHPFFTHTKWNLVEIK